MCVLCSIASRKHRKSLVSKVNRQRACWSLKMLSIGRDFAGFSRPTAFSKCQRPHFCMKIAPVGATLSLPSAAAEPAFIEFTNYFGAIIHLFQHRKPKGIHSDEQIPFVALSHRLFFAM